MISLLKCKTQQVTKVMPTRSSSQNTSGSKDLSSAIRNKAKSHSLPQNQGWVHVPVALDWPADEDSRKEGHHICGSTVSNDNPKNEPSLTHERGKQAYVKS
jgi:hypothetical protein